MKNPTKKLVRLSEIPEAEKLAWNKKWLRFKRKLIKKHGRIQIAASLADFCSKHNLATE